MGFECKYCRSILATKSSLNNHQKTTRRCLDTREIKNTTHICEYCDKIFTTKQMLTAHFSICEKKKNNDIEEEHKAEIKNIEDKYKVEIKYILERHESEIKTLDKEIELLRERVKELLKMLKDEQKKSSEITTDIIKPLIKKVGNKTIQNTQNSFVKESVFNNHTEEYIKKQIDEKLNRNYIPRSLKEWGYALADFYIDHISRDKNGITHICIKSGNIFIYIDSDGNMVEDKEGKLFLDNLKKSKFYEMATKRFNILLSEKEKKKYKTIWDLDFQMIKKIIYRLGKTLACAGRKQLLCLTSNLSIKEKEARSKRIEKKLKNNKNKEDELSEDEESEIDESEECKKGAKEMEELSKVSQKDEDFSEDDDTDESPHIIEVIKENKENRKKESELLPIKWKMYKKCGDEESKHIEDIKKESDIEIILKEQFEYIKEEGALFNSDNPKIIFIENILERDKKDKAKEDTFVIFSPFKKSKKDILIAILKDKCEFFLTLESK